MNRRVRASANAPEVMLRIVMFALPPAGATAKLYEPSVPPETWLTSTMSSAAITELLKLNVTEVAAARFALSVTIIPVGRLSVTEFVLAPAP